MTKEERKQRKQDRKEQLRRRHRVRAEQSAKSRGRSYEAFGSAQTPRS
jgi:hypothetical protein